MDFNPTERIHALLGSSPTNPWALLIPQVLLWCFRRFCIEKLISFEGTLYESLWEDHLELVQRYCPKGLEQAAMEWMTPENISCLHSPLKDYNKFFIDCIIKLDMTIMAEDYASQDELSELLDTKMCTIISDWVTMKEFLIFPTSPTEDDEFSEKRFGDLINALLENAKEHSVRNPVAPVTLSESLLWKYLSHPLFHEVKRVSVPQYPVPQYPVQQYQVPQYPVQQYPVQQYPVQQYPVQQYPVQQYQVPQYPVPQYPVPQYPVQQYQVPQYPVAQEPVPQYPAAQEPVAQEPVAQEPGAQFTKEPVSEESIQAPVPPPTDTYIPTEKPPRLLFNRTIASGIAYRRTIRKNQRIYLSHHGKTRKSHPAA